MHPNLLLSFWGVTFLLIVVPGPDWAFVLSSGARDRVVLPAVSGLMLGYALLTMLVAAGIGAVIGRSPLMLTVLTVGGACYLIHLGVPTVRRPGSVHADADAGARPRTTGARVLRGIGVSGLNPKGLLIFLALLPQFTDARGTWPVPVQLAALGLVFVVTCGAFYTVVGLSARTILNVTPAASRFVSRISGTAMIVVGVGLLIERLVLR